MSQQVSALVALARVNNQTAAVPSAVGICLDHLCNAVVELSAELDRHVLAASVGDAAEVDKLRKRVALLERAIDWACGLGEGFSKPQSAGPFWWRDELRLRAGLPWPARKGGGS